MFTKNAQPLHALPVAVCPCIAPQQRQAQIALGRHITGRWITAIKIVERITAQLFCQLLSQHLGVEVQLLGTATEGTLPTGGLIGLGRNAHNVESANRGGGRHVTWQPDAGAHGKQGQTKQHHNRGRQQGGAKKLHSRGVCECWLPSSPLGFAELRLCDGR